MKEQELSYQVLMNHEEQYSIWPSKKEIPNGWIAVGQATSKEECLTYIKEHWLDMRPLSLRMAMTKNG